ncbi:hypothetical protein ACQJBY_036189 [Aegilops geniculata]
MSSRCPPMAEASPRCSAQIGPTRPTPPLPVLTNFLPVLRRPSPAHLFFAGVPQAAVPKIGRRLPCSLLPRARPPCFLPCAATAPGGCGPPSRGHRCIQFGRRRPESPARLGLALPLSSSGAGGEEEEGRARRAPLPFPDLTLHPLGR